MNDNQKALLSFVVGTAAGVAAGILLAPYAGKDTRKRLADGAASLSQEAGNQLEDTLHKISEFADSALATITNYSNEMKTKFDTTAEKVADKTSSTANRAADKVSEKSTAAANAVNRASQN